MNVYGLKKEQLDFINSSIDSIIGEDSSLRVYLFGSRATGKHRQNSDIDIAIKSKQVNIDKKISELKDIFKESDIPYKVDLVNWDLILEDYKAGINKDKKLIFKGSVKK